MTITLHLPSFPLCPQELCFFVYHHIQSSQFHHHIWSNFWQPGPPETLLSQACSDVTEDAHSSLWQLPVPQRTPTLAVGEEGGSTSSSVLQILMHRINSCGVWVTEQRYPRVGSYSMYPAVNTTQLAELEGQAGSSSALSPLSPRL